MTKFRILFHGQLAKAEGQVEGVATQGDPYEGFYASRLLVASSPDAAILRGRELIRTELDATLLRGRPGDLISLEVEELEEVGGVDDEPPNKGFTFY